MVAVWCCARTRACRRIALYSPGFRGTGNTTGPALHMNVARQDGKGRRFCGLRGPKTQLPPTNAQNAKQSSRSQGRTPDQTAEARRNAARQSRNRRLNRLKGLDEFNEENNIGNFVAGCEELGLLQYREGKRFRGFAFFRG